MKCVTITLGLALLAGGGGSVVLAAEVGGFFSCHEIVFFEPCPTTAAQPPSTEDPRNAGPREVSEAPSAEAPRIEESIWAEPVRGPDGQLRVYLPPRPVRDFLEKPTPENARAYLAWNLTRMRRMDEAVSVMRDVAAQEFGIATQGPITVQVAPPEPNAGEGGGARQPLPPPFPPPSATVTTQLQGPSSGDTAARRISIVYAFATWCPYSRQQMPTINQLATRVPVRGVAFESKPEDVQALRPTLAFPVVHGDAGLRQRLGVRSYPTLFFYEGPRLLHIARGLQSPDHLVAVLAALASRQPLPALGSGGQPAGDTCQLRS
jgi:thiol-disulfide isomerase/thioredoxin